MPNGSAVVVNTQDLLFEKDTMFNELYDRGIKISSTPLDDNRLYFSKRRIRFYNTIQLLRYNQGLEGAIIECGCFRGLSSFLMCNFLRLHNPRFTGGDFFVVDSFEGLSQPTQEDETQVAGTLAGKFFAGAGHFATGMETVRNVLSEFPDVTLVKGWIPEVLSTLPERKYRFVHIDLDLYVPIKTALEYFYPRLVGGGMIVVDDYGSLYWPGAKHAVDEFCAEHGKRFLNISTAQAVIW